MIYGIADVGSNTVRLSIYKCEGGEIRLLMNRKVMAGLAGYVRHGALTPEGIEVACQTLQGYRSLMDNLELPDLRVFATASLRNISNTEEAVGAVMAATGLRVDVLTGREEAELSFRGAIQNAGLYTGLLVDLGGGSTELVSYEDGHVTSSCSLPVGSLSLFSRYVDGLFPTAEERRRIRAAVEAELDKAAPLDVRHRHLVGVGGTFRAARKLCNDLSGVDPENPVIPAGEIRGLYRKLKRGTRPPCARSSNPPLTGSTPFCPAWWCSTASSSATRWRPFRSAPAASGRATCSTGSSGTGTEARCIPCQITKIR